MIVPSGCADLLSKYIQHVLDDQSKESGRGKWTVKFQPKSANPLPKGACANLLLAKLNITLNFITAGSQNEEYVYELDLRELRKDETYLEDPKCRDFKINSMYYSVMDEVAKDIAGVGGRHPVVQGYQRQRHKLR